MIWVLLFLGLTVYLAVKVFGSGSKKTSISSSTHSLPSVSREQIAQKLEEFAESPEYDKEKKTYLAIAHSLRTGQRPVPQHAAPKSAINTAASSVLAPTTAQDVSVLESLNQSSQPVSPREKINPFYLLENINVLLFIGAFLVVISVAILVGSNYEAVSDGLKMLLATLLVGGFYASGLWLYKNKPKLRPAGVTFASIGMILVPMLGVAYRNFMAPDERLSVVWFGASIGTVAAYALATRVLRRSVVQYALIVAFISMLESGLLSFDAPLYLLAWVSTLTAMLMLMIDRTRIDADVFDRPLLLSAHVLAPATILFSFMAADAQWWRVAVTVLLSAVFYGQASWLARQRAVSVQYFVTCIALLPLALWLILIDQGLDVAVTAFVLVMMAGGYAIATLLPHDYRFKQALLNVCYVLMSLSLMLAFLGQQANVLIAGLAFIAAAVVLLYTAWVKAGALSSRADVVAAASTLAAGVAVLLEYADATAAGIGLGVVGLSALYALMAILLNDMQAPALRMHSRYLRGTSIVVAFVGLLFALLSANMLLIALVLVVAVHVITSWQLRSLQSLWVALAAMLAVPLPLFIGVVPADDGVLVRLVTLYVVIAAVLFVVRMLLKSSQDVFVQRAYAVLGSGYALALAGAWLVSLGDSGWLQFGLAVGLSLVVWGVSYYEKRPQIVAVSIVMQYAAVFQAFRVLSLFEQADTVSLIFLLGIFHYALRFLMESDYQRLRIWRISAFVAFFLALFNENQALSIVAHMTCATAGFYEFHLLRNNVGRYVMAALQVVALNRLLYFVGVHDVHLHSLLWAAYFAAIGYTQHLADSKANRDLATIAALSAFSIPLAIQSFDSGAALRGLLLIGESTALVFLGIAIRYRLVRIWGVVALVLEVLYQTREVIFAIPKQVISLGIGLLILGIAIYFLVKRNDEGEGG